MSVSKGKQLNASQENPSRQAEGTQKQKPSQTQDKASKGMTAACQNMLTAMSCQPHLPAPPSPPAALMLNGEEPMKTNLQWNCYTFIHQQDPNQVSLPTLIAMLAMAARISSGSSRALGEAQFPMHILACE